MNSAYIWIAFPIAISVVLFLLQKRKTLVAIIAMGTSALLAGLAAWLPMQDQIVLWRWVLPYSDTLNILGRKFVLSAAERPSLMVIYFIAALWFGAVPLARPNRLFVPLSLAMVALLTAAIAVEPFLFAGVLIVIAVLVSLPFLSPPGTRVGRGVLRYLSFQTIGMPFILISGFMFTGLEVGPGNPEYVAIAAALLVIGFALMLGIFPFNTWILMLAEKAHPYPTAFVFLLLPIAVSMFGFGFFDNYVWLKDNPSTTLLLQVTGVVMVITAGVWGAVEKHIVRLMGFAIIVDVGFSLIAMGLAVDSEAQIYRLLFYALLVPRGLSLGILALASSALLQRSVPLEFNKVRGLSRQLPIISVSVLIALFCIAGMPLLASFPIKLAILEGISVSIPQVSIWVILGSLGLLAGAARLMLSMVSDSRENLEIQPESRLLKVFLLVGILILVMIGIFPNIFIQLVSNFPVPLG